MNKLVVKLGNNIAIFNGDDLSYNIDEDKNLTILFNEVETIIFYDWTLLRWLSITSGNIEEVKEYKENGEDGEEGIEMIINGSFEDGTNGWTVVNAIRKEGGHSGNYCMELGYHYGGGDYITQETSIPFNTLLSFSIWLKGLIGTKLDVYIEYDDGDAYDEFELTLSLNNTWEKFNILSHLSNGINRNITFIQFGPPIDAAVIDITDISAKVSEG